MSSRTKIVFAFLTETGRYIVTKKMKTKRRERTRREGTRERACATGAHLATESFYSAFSTCRRRANVGGLIPTRSYRV